MGSKETEKLRALDISVTCRNTPNDLQQNLSPYQKPGCYLVTLPGAWMLPHNFAIFDSYKTEHPIVTSSLTHVETGE